MKTVTDRRLSRLRRRARRPGKRGAASAEPSRGERRRSSPEQAILLDASALVAAATGEPAAAEVGELLRGGDCAVTTANLAELYDQLVRRVGLTAEAVAAHVQPLLHESLAVRDLDRCNATRAGLLRAELYRRRTAELSLADCVLLASLEGNDTVATADPPLARAARRLGHDVAALPDSRGQRP